MPTDKSQHILPDVLKRDLLLWFVGTAAGPKSAAVGAYYAHRGNRFWGTLHATGITSERFEAEAFRDLLPRGIGLTDICKTAWGTDSQLPKDRFDVAGFKEKVRRYRPRGLAFTSKTAASHWLGRPTGRISFGKQERGALAGFDGEAFVLPSPSGLATSYWSIEPWQEVAAWYAQLSGLARG